MAPGLRSASKRWINYYLKQMLQMHTYYDVFAAVTW